MANYLRLTVPAANRGKAQEILDRTRYTIDYYGDYFNTLLRFHRYYLSANERPSRPDPPDVDDAVEWRSRLFVPYSFATIETATPRLVFSWWGQRPPVQMIGRNIEDHTKQRQVNGVLDYDLERSECAYKSVLAAKSFLKYGITLGRVTYERRIRSVPITTTSVKPIFDAYGNVVGGKEVTETGRKDIKEFDGPLYEPVSVFNCFPDPLEYEIERMRYFVELQVTSLSRLREQDEGYYNLTGKHLYKNLDNLEGMFHGEATLRAGAWLGDAREETAAVFGYGGAISRFGPARGGMPGARAELGTDEVWLLHYWTPDEYAVLANGTEIIREGDNPYSDGIPYFSANCFPIEFEFYGLGLLHSVQGLQEEVNSWRSIALDQGKINLMKPIAYDAASGLTDLDFDIFPGMAIPVKFESGKPLATPLFPRDSLPPETWQMESMLLRDWQNALGINDYMVGGTPGQAGTASEAAMLNQSAATRFKLQSFIGQKRYVERLARMMFRRRQQYLDEYEIFRIKGREGYEFPELGPDDLAGEYDFLAMGSIMGPMREVERTQITQFLSVAATNPVMAQRLNWDELLNELVLKFDFPFPERFVLPPNQFQMAIPDLEKMLQMAIEMGDDRLVESLVQEIQTRMATEQGGGPGGANAGTRMQAFAGGVGQGAGQLGAGTPNMGSLQAETMGGPGSVF